MWVAVGEISGGSTIRFSYDGITWNRATVGIFGGYGYGVAWNGRIWVAVGDEGGLTTTIKYSNDGIIWNDVSSAGFTVWGNGIAWNGSMWVAVGQGGSTIRYSYDGLTWNNASSGEFSSLGAGIAWNGALWVAVGAGGGSTIKYSYDGINWNSSSSSGDGVFSSSGLGVAWNGSIWVAVGNGGSIKYSRDGIIWYNSSSSGDGLFSGYGSGISWNGSLWVAVGFGGGATIKYSKDGIVWSNAAGSIFINEGFGVANNYSVLPDYSAKELNLYLKGQPVFLSSTNQILATLSTIVINNTLYVDKTSNRVGINVAPNDNYTLDVNGNVRASTVTVTGICYAQQFVTVSDAIAKTNIREWTSSAIDTLAQIRPYSFNYIGGVESIGLLAQEVEAAYPQLIQERGSTKYVNYDGVVALLLKAVKELKGHVSSLQGSGSPIHSH